MAKTKDEWYVRLKGWLPTWWFEETENQEAILYGMAAVLERLEGSLEEHVKETFICQSAQGFLDEHGWERNVFRETGELDPEFCVRVQTISNTTNCPSIKDIVDALLQVGVCTIVEDYEGSAFLDRDDYLNRGEILIDPIMNTFSIIVDRQVHAPYSFYSREYFCDREDFIGTNESDIKLFELIVAAVNKNKALGTLYRLIERLET